MVELEEILGFRFHKASSARLWVSFHGNIFCETSLLAGRFPSTKPEFLCCIWSLQTESRGSCSVCRLCQERTVRLCWPLQAYLRVKLTHGWLNCYHQYWNPKLWVGQLRVSQPRVQVCKPCFLKRQTVARRKKKHLTAAGFAFFWDCLI